MIDNVTHKATRVDFRPVRLDVMLRHARERRLLAGYLVQQLIEAAHRLWPGFTADAPDRLPLTGHPIEQPPAAAPATPFMPRWRRRLQDRTEEDDDVGI